MPLSEDSRALLQLLLGRGKSYADISGLLGIDEAEVRQRAGAALAEVDSSAPAPDPDLTDYLLGQADPITRADVGNRIASDPELAEQTESLSDQLRLLIPGAELPKPGPAAPEKVPPASRPEDPATQTDAPSDQKSAASSGKSGFSSITGHQRRLIAILLGGALLAAVVILLVTGALGGSEDDPDAPQPSPTVAVLQPVGDEQGSGQVQFGFAGTTLAANLQIGDLEPSQRNQGYVIWLHGSSGSFPIYATRVDESGAISGQIDLNEAVICLIASDFFPSLRVSRSNNREFNRALDQASLTNRQDVRLPKYTGQTVLEGSISMPQDAKDTIVPICNGTANQAQQE